MNSSYFFAVIALAVFGVSSLSAQAVTTITSTPPSTVGANQSLNFQYTASGFSTTVTYTVPPGELPPGLSLSSAGVLSGTPTSPGDIGNTYTGTVTASDGVDTPATQNFSINVVTTLLNTVPEGMLTLSLPASGGGATSYFSLPLTADPVYSGYVSAVTATTISVTVDANDPAPFVNGATGVQLANLATPSLPYFVKFLSGQQMGRVIEVTANTSSSLTLDTTDASSQTTPLTGTAGFSVTAGAAGVGDTFEVFPAATMGSLFGDNSKINPLLLVGSSSIAFADTVSIFDPIHARFQAYFFNTSAGFWEQSGSITSANNTIIYPYSALEISRRRNEAALAIAPMAYESSIAASGDAAANILVPMSRVAEVAIITKTPGSSKVVYSSTNYPVDMTLSQLMSSPAYSSNWTQNASIAFASTLSIYDSVHGRFDTYYENNNVWLLAGDATLTSQNNFVIPAGSLITILKRGSVSLQTSFLSSALPYSLN